MLIDVGQAALVETCSSWTSSEAELQKRCLIILLPTANQQAQAGLMCKPPAVLAEALAYTHGRKHMGTGKTS